VKTRPRQGNPAKSSEAQQGCNNPLLKLYELHCMCHTRLLGKLDGLRRHGTQELARAGGFITHAVLPDMSKSSENSTSSRQSCKILFHWKKVCSEMPLHMSHVAE